MNVTRQSGKPLKSFEHVHQALQAAGHHIRPRGTHAFMVSCPRHTDRSPSLSVTWQPSARGGRATGKALMHCYSCQASAADLAAAAGLRVDDLFNDPAPAPANPPKRCRSNTTAGVALVSGAHAHRSQLAAAAAAHIRGHARWLAEAAHHLRALQQHHQHNLRRPRRRRAAPSPTLRMNTGADTLVTAQVTTAITAAAGRTGGPAAHTARAWIDGLSARAQLRSERHVRSARPQPR